MTFSQEWDERYQRTGPTSLWPWSDLVRLFRRFCASRDGRKLRVLELGCGYGANIPFFLAEGVDYYAIEGSPTAVHAISQRFPNLANNIVVADFTAAIPFDLVFDVVIDRSSLTHNDTNSIKRTLDSCLAKLSSRGMYVGIDWFSDEHSELRHGCPIEGDPFTFHAFAKGLFCGVGKVHASTDAHLKALFESFDFLWLEKKTVQQKIPDVGACHATWNLVASKR